MIGGFLLQRMEEKMMDLNRKGYPNKALNILNELKGMEIEEAQEMLDWCRERLLHQPSSGWSIYATDDNRRCTFIADSQCPGQDLCKLL